MYMGLMFKQKGFKELGKLCLKCNESSTSIVRMLQRLTTVGNERGAGVHDSNFTVIDALDIARTEMRHQPTAGGRAKGVI